MPKLTMPGPQRAARIGVTIGQRLGLTRYNAAAAVKRAVDAAMDTCQDSGIFDMDWLEQVWREAHKIACHSRPPTT